MLSYIELKHDGACIGHGKNLGLVFTEEDCAYLVDSFVECGGDTFAFLKRGDTSGLCFCLPPDQEVK